MISSISSMIGMAAAYCCSNACSAVCNSCLGTTLEGTTGRKRSVLLLVFAIGASFFFEYKLGPAIVSEEGWIWKTYNSLPTFGKLIHRGCK